MIVTKTPLRLGFFGGGSDIPEFYNKTSGLVLSTTIDKCIQIAVNRCEPKHVRVIYSELEQVNTASELRHTRAREVLKEFNIKSNIEIASFSDITTRGSGLGSSSSYTVGLINALCNLMKLGYTKRDLAETACNIEINILNEPIGKQDQYAAAYGGMNVFHFHPDGVEVVPLNIRYSMLAELNDNLMCYNTGITRDASSVLSDQVQNLKTGVTAFESTSMLVDQAALAIDYLTQGKLDDFGALMDNAWTVKKQLSPNVSNENIDIMYDIAKRNGALGGKLLGAGGGGYMLFYVPNNSKNNVANAMKHYKRFHFKFTDKGSSASEV